MSKWPLQLRRSVKRACFAPPFDVARLFLLLLFSDGSQVNDVLVGGQCTT